MDLKKTWFKKGKTIFTFMIVMVVCCGVVGYIISKELDGKGCKYNTSIITD